MFRLVFSSSIESYRSAPARSTLGKLDEALMILYKFVVLDLQAVGTTGRRH